MLTTKLDNPNYRAKIVKIDRLEPHPNADKLLITTIDFQKVIVGLDTKIGDLCIYFPLESQINSEFVSFINGYSSADLNKDKTKKGFFGKPRVRATKLRGVMSEGYLHPIGDFNLFLQEKGIKFQVTEKEVGTEFDSVGDLLICQKYIVKQKGLPGPKNPNKKLKRLSRVVDGQVRLHADTKHLKKEIYRISPDDFIDISSKWHGANCGISRVLVKRRLSLVDRISKIFGAKIQETEYDLVYFSRRVVKNEYADQQTADFYNEDVWGKVAKKYEKSIQEGITCYGELVGYTSTGAGIQSAKGVAYDYGCQEGECDFYVFRITYTTHDGQVYEFSINQIKEYCKKYELKTTPSFYSGLAKDMYPELDVNNHWHENFLNKLIEDYLEKDCVYCRNSGLPDEGLVVAKRDGHFDAFKLKSNAFTLVETGELDKEQTNIEDEQ